MVCNLEQRYLHFEDELSPAIIHYIVNLCCVENLLDYGDLANRKNSRQKWTRYLQPIESGILANLEQTVNIDKSRWLAAILDSEKGSS